MLEPRVSAVRESIPEFIPLARAAAIVHDRLFPSHPSKDSKTLDLIALALSELVPMYQRDMNTGALRALTQQEVAAGRFTRGATTLEIAGRPALRYLVVSREQALAAAETLARDPVRAARVSLPQRQSAQASARR
jgi:hypothetical protein